jgi:hypothetical protein
MRKFASEIESSPCKFLLDPRIGSSDFHIQRDETLLSLSRLKLHGVPLVKIFDLGSGRKATAMKEYIFTSVVRSDESKPFLSHDFLDRSSHG